METQAGVAETTRKARRAMFWRLYTIPWLLLTLTLGLLAGIGFYQANLAAHKVIPQKKAITIERIVYTNVPYVITNVIVVMTNVDMSVLNIGIVELQEATLIQQSQAEKYRKEGEILTGVAKGLLAAKKIEAGSKVKAVETKEPQPTMPAQAVFEAKDWELARSVGYDLEKDMIKNVGDLISYEMKAWDGRDVAELQLKLKNGSERLIRKSFDGFKTYNGVRNEKR